MTLGQLRAFLAVAETGSVRAAADRLVVTQPAVSSAVAALGRSVGVALTSRDGRGLRLTPAGEVFAGYARRVLALLEEGVASATGSAAPERGRLRLGAVTTAAEYVVPPFLASFRAGFPAVRLELEVGNRARVWSLLDDHLVDLVVGGRPPASLPVVVLATRPNELVLVAPPGLALEDDRQLADCTWLLREPGSGTRAAVEDLLRVAAIDPSVLTLGSNGAIRESVMAGLGVAVLSRDAVAAQLAGGEVVEWVTGPFPAGRPWHLVARSDSSMNPTTQLFVDHLISPGAGTGAGFRAH